MARHTANKQTGPSSSKPPAPSAQTRPRAPESRPGPTNEQIARRAYEVFLARGGTHGNSEQDWFQAERELRLGRQ
ncbi:hypothetical protein MXAN_1975 [Myxococcus xanthus DK 1622]|uniref:DUF2934 domain-containing protein n=1 Tax=Myxococcus xanthus (strain DK1622) TaxID=246197 RepID=Q1DAW3_MYXXD|nr:MULTISPECIES: DUF2934 domain-containing protein [Myxococcus]ABF88194.1 hypothetical protein MXAN_1975 [Myxococcus xanthus DK 1622]NOJ57442.1 DUF2934 domain-containing protein [Myxococcus xanthus]QPM81547.1 DUF2934 domain-containing protein [Myxococcus xanthus]QVW70797.1 DUF2934 domain-containing protein [Myxococcus xanthus DZ2]QZZ49715.1 hypothetical protein MyxoNM_10935 [Myxococcus xanthus]